MDVYSVGRWGRDGFVLCWEVGSLLNLMDVGLGENNGKSRKGLVALTQLPPHRFIWTEVFVAPGAIDPTESFVAIDPTEFFVAIDPTESFVAIDPTEFFVAASVDRR